MDASQSNGFALQCKARMCMAKRQCLALKLVSYSTGPGKYVLNNFISSISLIDELQKKGIKAASTIGEDYLKNCVIISLAEISKKSWGDVDYRSTGLIIARWNGTLLKCSAAVVLVFDHSSLISSGQKVMEKYSLTQLL